MNECKALQETSPSEEFINYLYSLENRIKQLEESNQAKTIEFKNLIGDKIGEEQFYQKIISDLKNMDKR